MILPKKQITKFLKGYLKSCLGECADVQAALRICRYKSPKTLFLSRSPIAICHFTMNASKESKMRNLIIVKYDITQTELLFVQTLQSIYSVYVDTPRVILLVTVFFIIQPDLRT